MLDAEAVTHSAKVTSKPAQSTGRLAGWLHGAWETRKSPAREGAPPCDTASPPMQSARRGPARVGDLEPTETYRLAGTWQIAFLGQTEPRAARPGRDAGE